MSTKLLFMDHFNVVTADASVLDVVSYEDRLDAILGQTCFYPRGGGQDYDQGIIRSDSGALFQVEEVRLDESGVVHHFGVFDEGAFVAGDKVALVVNEQRRTLNTRLHSAGHLVDMAVDELGYGWVPGKGAHYPHMSNVEYTGEWSADEKDKIIADIQSLATQYVDRGGRNEIRFMPVEEMDSICKHVPENLPANKPARVVIYRGDFGVPCGGTHVADLSEVGAVSIDKIKKKSGNIRVSYSLRDANPSDTIGV